MVQGFTALGLKKLIIKGFAPVQHERNLSKVVGWSKQAHLVVIDHIDN